ncbi:hypothetical protein NQ317_017426 [Molorchus minor]|uniref:Uncharacterized protein n=1 Tax=Molorchus minor TaxID=1323400 RepID=A0ABQ9IWP6_9CUCU|nr:hypothetical protein NQ317_017426 [Molorchus minor]
MEMCWVKKGNKEWGGIGNEKWFSVCLKRLPDNAVIIMHPSEEPAVPVRGRDLLYSPEKTQKTRYITKSRAIGEMRISTYTTTHGCITNPSGITLSAPARFKLTSILFGNRDKWTYPCD